MYTQPQVKRDVPLLTPGKPDLLPTPPPQLSCCSSISPSHRRREVDSCISTENATNSFTFQRKKGWTSGWSQLILSLWSYCSLVVWIHAWEVWKINHKARYCLCTEHLLLFVLQKRLMYPHLKIQELWALTSEWMFLSLRLIIKLEEQTRLVSTSNREGSLGVWGVNNWQ